LHFIWGETVQCGDAEANVRNILIRRKILICQYDFHSFPSSVSSGASATLFGLRIALSWIGCARACVVFEVISIRRKEIEVCRIFWTAQIMQDSAGRAE